MGDCRARGRCVGGDTEDRRAAEARCIGVGRPCRGRGGGAVGSKGGVHVQRSVVGPRYGQRANAAGVQQDKGNRGRRRPYPRPRGLVIMGNSTEGA